MKALVAALTWLALTTPLFAGVRVASLDQCSDQYVLALADRSDIAFLSPRVLAANSWLKDKARGLPIRRPSVEAIFAAHPQMVVRQWGGGSRLDLALERRGITTARVEETQTFDGVARNVRTIAAALGHAKRGEPLVNDMQARLARARGAWRDVGGLYLTDGAFTAGPGTLIDAILRAAGMTNLATRPGYQPAPLERLMLAQPRVMVFGRFDSPGHGRWSPVSGSLLHQTLSGTKTVELPGALLGCPAWFAADAVERLAAAAP